jgi:hypothetical protein
MGFVEGFIGWGEGIFDSTNVFLSGIIHHLDSRFLYPGALILVLALIPFLILYLIRPKPQELAMSSIMFLIRDTGKSFIKTFFRTFTKDPLFIIQLLILLCMIAAAARPFVTLPEVSIDKPTVIIIDGSGSMQAQARFEQAKAIAQENLASTTTIILAKNVPETVGIDQTKRKSSAIISALAPADTETNLYDALLLAPSYLKEPGRIVVISDFAADPNYVQAKRFLEGQGHKVYLEKVGTPAKNVGIVDLDVREKKTTLAIKNYNSEEAAVKVKVNGELIDQKTIPGQSSDLVSFTTPGGTSKVELEYPDDYALDNVAYLSAPENKTLSVLIVSNDNAIRSYDFVLALDAINANSTTHIAYDVAVPPKVPKPTYDLVIFKNVNASLLLPGTVEDTSKRVKSGGAAIIMIQDDIKAIAYNDLFPYTFKSKEIEGLVEKTGTALSLTDNVDFGTVGTYFVLTPKDDVLSIATVSQSPIIAFKPLDKGIVMWYGIFDESADFAKDPYYPIFWKRTIDFLAGKPDIRDLNYKTGLVLALPEKKTVKTPSGSITTSTLFLDKAGVYIFPDKNVAANLISNTESDLNGKDVQTTAGTEALAEKPVAEPFDLSTYLIIAALVCIAIELIYLKYRGDV